MKTTIRENGRERTIYHGPGYPIEPHHVEPEYRCVMIPPPSFQLKSKIYKIEMTFGMALETGLVGGHPERN